MFEVVIPLSCGKFTYGREFLLNFEQLFDNKETMFQLALVNLYPFRHIMGAATIAVSRTVPRILAKTSLSV